VKFYQNLSFSLEMKRANKSSTQGFDFVSRREFLQNNLISQKKIVNKLRGTGVIYSSFQEILYVNLCYVFTDLKLQ
jgi:hypothetical protein